MFFLFEKKRPFLYPPVYPPFSHKYTCLLWKIANLEDIAVARNLPAAEMITGRKAAVVFFDDYSPKEAVVIAVYT